VEDRNWLQALWNFRNKASVFSTNPRTWAHTVSLFAQSVDFKYTDSTPEPHTLLSDACDERIVLAKRDPLDGGRELPSEQAFASLGFPEPHGIVSSARYEELGFR